MKNPHVIISRENPFFNFGQIVDVIDLNGFTDRFIVKDYSSKSLCNAHYYDIYPCNEMHDYEKLNRAISMAG